MKNNNFTRIIILAIVGIFILSSCNSVFGLDLDINITVPESASEGAKGSIITATANCI